MKEKLSLNHELEFEKQKNSVLETKLKELELENQKLREEITTLKQKQKPYAFKLPSFDEVMDSIEFHEFN